jgi:uncharacterized protein (DUF849 family)
MEKRIVTAAITGAIHTPSMSPYLPITPTEIAREAVRAYEAGAAVAHIHMRNPENGRPEGNIDAFAEVAARIKEKTDMIICFTTGGALGMSVEDRLKVVPTFSPELASCNCGSINFALFHVLKRMKEFKYDWEKPFLEMTEDFIFPNTFRTLKQYAETFRQYGTRPELEVYDTGMINNIAYLLEEGFLEPPVYIQFVMGILGGIPATIDNLLFLYNTARKSIGEFHWSVCAAGRHQIPMCNMALLMDGHVRVGLEDSLYAARGKLAESNADQVEKIVRIARELGLEPAAPKEARHLLGLKGLEKVSY